MGIKRHKPEEIVSKLTDRKFDSRWACVKPPGKGVCACDLLVQQDVVAEPVFSHDRVRFMGACDAGHLVAAHPGGNPARIGANSPWM